MSRNTPWIILLCKFSDDPGNPGVRSVSDLVALFGGNHPDSIPSYWRDISYGELDLVAGTEISPWLTLPQKRSDHIGLSTRGSLFAWAKAAGAAAGVDFSRFFGTVVFFAVPTDLFGTSNDPHVVCDILSSPAQILQEYGHAYGLKNHSRAVEKPEDYENPFCVMSSARFGTDMELFRRVDPTFAGRWGSTGPGLCSPFVSELGWLAGMRSVAVRSNGRYPSTTVIELSALGERNPAHAQAAIVEFEAPAKARYFIEYRHGSCDRGIGYDPIVIQQVRADGIPYYAGLIRPFRDAPGAARGPAISVGKWYVDDRYDLSVEVLGVHEDRGSVTLRIAPAAAARTLSVRGIVASKLHLGRAFSLRTQVIARGQPSVRDRLIGLLGEP